MVLVEVVAHHVVEPQPPRNPERMLFYVEGLPMFIRGLSTLLSQFRCPVRFGPPVKLARDKTCPRDSIHETLV